MGKNQDIGVTPSEQYLGKLCRNSFLSLWCFPNPYTDRGSNKKNPQGKELCDLLVVFGRHVIIFSDKSCKFPCTGNVETDWQRWFKKAIDKSGQLIYGAEKWIKEFPNRVFLDKMCTQKFPLDFPPIDKMKIHRVVVALGAGDRCAEYFGGNSRGSLMLSSTICGKDHYFTPGFDGPFRVGWLNRDKGYVHVFDDVSLDIVMGELDTVSDFVRYLERKEEIISSNAFSVITGEEELLGFYLQNLDESGEPTFELKGKAPELDRRTILTEGHWDGYQSSDYKYERAKIIRNGSFIDGLIEHFSSHITDGTLAYGNELGLSGNERNVRFLAAEHRLQRAMMSLAIGKKVASTPRNIRTSIVMPSSVEETMFVFLLLPRGVGQSYSNYRHERQAALTAYANVVKLKFAEARYVYGLATEPGVTRQGRSEDLLSFDFDGWTEADARAAEKMQKERNILTEFSSNSVLYDPPNTNRPDLLLGNRKERRKQMALSKKRH